MDWIWCQAPCLQVCLKCVLVGVPLIAMHLEIVEGLLSEAATCIGLARAWENGPTSSLHAGTYVVVEMQCARCQVLGARGVARIAASRGETKTTSVNSLM